MTSCIYNFFKLLEKENPHPKTELFYTNSYTLLVASVLSAQATDKGVNKVTKELFKKIDDPKKMVDFGINALLESIKSIGLFRNKAKNILALSDILLEKFDGQIPNNKEDLESLPGVGRKTANVVLNVVFGKEVIPVDTHVFRVANRTGIAKGKTPLQVEENLLKITPERFLKYAHHWLVLHGRYVCLAKKPKCDMCCVNDLCDFFLRNNR
ncbi:MAG: endonuclease III [Alphaproteobacteria bacterium]